MRLALLLLLAAPVYAQTTVTIADVRHKATGQLVANGTVFDGLAAGERAECVITEGRCVMRFAAQMKAGGVCVWERGTDPMRCNVILWATVGVAEEKKPRRRAVKH